MLMSYPGYQTLYEIARSMGCSVSYWKPHLHPNSHTRAFEIEELEHMMQPNTRVQSQAGLYVSAYERDRLSHDYVNCLGAGCDCKLSTQSYRGSSEQVRVAATLQLLPGLWCLPFQ